MASAINVLIPPFGNATTAGVRSNFATAKSEIEALQNLRNNAGQIKANYSTTLSLVNFTALTAQSFNIAGATVTLSSFPTTTFPASSPTDSYADLFDATRGTSPSGRLIENPIGGQVHFWRIQGTYANKAAAQQGFLKLRIRNPVSGFIYDQAITMPDGITGDNFNLILVSIADGASIPSPNGYVLETLTSFTDTDFTVNVTSITRISFAVDQA